MKTIVYTTNLDGYDALHESPKSKWSFVDKDIEYLYYTDGEAPSGWEKVPMKTGDRKASRFYKINSHLLPPHDISIYIDASYIFKKPMGAILDNLRGDIAISAHGKDNCLYKHAVTCITCKLDDPIEVFKQVGRYAQEGYPRDIGLTENSLIIRRNNGIIKELNELWWQEYQRGSQRDQLSLPYALWKVKPKFNLLPFSARENKWLGNWGIHLKDRKWILNK
jgi:hypothetical protein